MTTHTRRAVTAGAASIIAIGLAGCSSPEGEEEETEGEGEDEGGGAYG